MTSEILALIPARGGSKGIPRKNIRTFAGHPLIAWSIAAAKQSELVSRVVVSTEDEEIAAVAREYGAETPFLRPVELAQDRATDLPVFEHALKWFEDVESYRADVIVQLRPTSPLRRSEEHTSELQSRLHLVCRLLLEKKIKNFCEDYYFFEKATGDIVLSLTPLS